MALIKAFYLWMALYRISWMFVILGVVVAVGMMLIDYRKLERLGWLFYIIGVLILFMISYFPNDCYQWRTVDKNRTDYN